ncbi:MAG: NAD-dependent epimerase/dehydratase family protein [Cytophagales bacterium]|nr:NAD-dependent epimerase/dehydratase family protein [Cytophagales bacterium]MDW8385154.1 NAD-dependent epimerase/dehydratase family protein [Flammeovirgaceae bacterium]
MNPKILVTGTAGFIGHHLALKLASLGYEVIGLDEINDYYDTTLKRDRLSQQGISTQEICYGKLLKSSLNSISFIQLKLEDKTNLYQLFASQKFQAVVHLAAQAGVRYSLTHPEVYINSNITGFLHILEACRHYGVKELLYASSSSVYGTNTNYPFREDIKTETPISLYAASKKANELMAHTYSYLFGIRTSGLRFFTVYGPWGRPDMALFLFTKSILEQKPIEVFNNGEMMRDFTYIDDIVTGVALLLEAHLQNSPKISSYQIYNIGNNSPVLLMDFVRALEKKLGKQAIIHFKPLQPGDVPKTYADASKLQQDVGYKPNTPIEYGIEKFIDWYRDYYKC